MQCRLLLAVFLAQSLTVESCNMLHGSNEATQASFPEGTAQRCVRDNSYVLGVLPGTGWDNLRNVEGGNIFHYNYSLCKTTLDGRFLVPDGVATSPRKYSKVNFYAETIVHFSNYTSIVSHSVNIHSAVSIKQVGVSGSFSVGYQQMKSKQLGGKSVLTRVQLRYVIYSGRLKAKAQLNPDFVARLKDIADNLGKNRSEEVSYKSQLLVRDFGTHYIHSVDAGAVLAQEDQISSEYVSTKASTSTDIAFAAGLTFAVAFSLNRSYSYHVSNSEVQEYLKQRSSSEIIAYGGPKFKTSKFDASDWVEGIDRDMVAVDRSGNPLYYIITPTNIPALQPSKVRRLQKAVKEAVDMYYEHNTYYGCTRLGSPNFSSAANVDDGTCEPTDDKGLFGGVYQTCELLLGGNGDICDKLDMYQKNPKTGDYSCPDGYESVKLHTHYIATPKPNPTCFFCEYKYWCCHEEKYWRYRLSKGEYSMYWCAGTSKAKQASGYLFGGFYTSQIDNTQTQDGSCPPYFISVQLGTDLKVCVSDDVERGSGYAIAFGGLFSCKTGNPLSSNSLEQTSWPKRCPVGYSRHLAYVDQGCQINYCLLAGSLSSTGLPRIARPPFMNPPDVDSAVKYQGLDPQTQKWVMAEDTEIEDGNKLNWPRTSDTAVSRNVIFGSIGGVIALVVLVVILVCTRRWSRRRRSSHNGPRSDPESSM